MTDLDALVRKYFKHSLKVLNPDDKPGGMDDTRALALMNEFVSKAESYTLEELLWALHSAAILTAVAMDEKMNPPVTTIEDQIKLLARLDEEHLLRLWYQIGQLAHWERSQRFTDAIVAEFKRRGMPVVPQTGI